MMQILSLRTTRPAPRASRGSHRLPQAGRRSGGSRPSRRGPLRPLRVGILSRMQDTLLAASNPPLSKRPPRQAQPSPSTSSWARLSSSFPSSPLPARRAPPHVPPEKGQRRIASGRPVVNARIGLIGPFAGRRLSAVELMQKTARRSLRRSTQSPSELMRHPRSRPMRRRKQGTGVPMAERSVPTAR